MSFVELLTPLNLLKVSIIIISAYGTSKILEYFLLNPIKKRLKKKGLITPLKRIISMIIYIGAFILILSVFNIDITSVVAALGVGAIVIGFGLKDIVSNWISGIIIIAERIYRIDDVIKIGNTTGVVKDISLRSTILQTYDKNEVIIPNSDIISEKVTNLTSGKNESVCSLKISVDYIFNTHKTKKIIENVLKKDENVVFDKDKRKEIRFVVRLKEWATEIEALFWINKPRSEEFIKSRITEAIKKDLEKEGILPPIPSIIRRDYMKPQK